MLSSQPPPSSRPDLLADPPLSPRSSAVQPEDAPSLSFVVKVPRNHCTTPSTPIPDAPASQTASQALHFIVFNPSSSTTSPSPAASTITMTVAPSSRSASSTFIASPASTRAPSSPPSFSLSPVSPRSRPSALSVVTQRAKPLPPSPHPSSLHRSATSSSPPFSSEHSFRQHLDHAPDVRLGFAPRPIFEHTLLLPDPPFQDAPHPPTPSSPSSSTTNTSATASPPSSASKLILEVEWGRGGPRLLPIPRDANVIYIKAMLRSEFPDLITCPRFELCLRPGQPLSSPSNQHLPLPRLCPPDIASAPLLPLYIPSRSEE